MKLMSMLTEAATMDQIAAGLSWPDDEVRRVLHGFELAELVERRQLQNTIKVFAVASDAGLQRRIGEALKLAGDQYSAKLVRDSLALGLLLRRQKPDVLLMEISDDVALTQLQNLRQDPAGYLDSVHVVCVCGHEFEASVSGQSNSPVLSLNCSDQQLLAAITGADSCQRRISGRCKPLAITTLCHRPVTKRNGSHDHSNGELMIMKTELTSELQEREVTAPCLRVTDAAGRATEFSLVEGESVFVGTSATCGVLLWGENVTPFHCMFCLNDGHLWVHDCKTGGTTLVNGQPIALETALNNGDELTVGNNKIVAILDSTTVVENEVAAELSDDDPEAVQDSVVAEDAVATFEPEPPLEYIYDHNPGDDDPADLAETLDECIDTSFGNEEIDLLRSEVELLQSELSQRDAELLHVREQLLSTCDVDEPADNEDVVRLVNRLEELRDELKSSDDRVLHVRRILAGVRRGQSG